MPKTVSLIQAAAVLNIHRNTLYGWLTKDGCPAVRRADRGQGVGWELDIGDIFEWRCEFLVRGAVASYQSEGGGITKDEADRRRAVAMAIVAEVEADTVLKSVARVDDMSAAMADFCQVLRSGLDNATHKIAHRTAFMTEHNEIHGFCEAELNRAFVNAKEELERLWEGRDDHVDDRDDDADD